ncbi:MAG: radical SAM protein [Desulfobulbaceae bacterium]|nr:radical SAM protein [Desulfobulbaceae bacterium]
MPISHLHEFFMQLHLTERCNLKCTHCYQSGGRTAELNREEISDLLSELTDMLQAWTEAYGIEFSSSLNVTGGEPLLRSDLLDILNEMNHRNFDVYLLTNGTLVDREMAAALAALAVKGVQVSIEGPEEIHDSIRGAGSFTAACRGISLLVDAGLTVTLNATLSEINCDRFAEMIALCTSLGAQRLGFSRLVPSGRGLDLVDRLIETDRVRQIYTEIFSINPATVQIVTGDPVASQMRSAESVTDCGEVATGGCAAGISGLTVLPDGTVVPCRRLPLPIGNVRTDSLREIWADSEILEQLRDRSRYSGKCGTCKRWAICRGCRAIAWADSTARGKADLFGDDPQCFIDG